ncbi:tRNA(Arg) A34 adenosine deaminase TadA [Bradyrhizobium sp. USDA 4459]
MDGLSDEHFLRLSFAVARRSSNHGNHPFGCIVVDADGKVLVEAENGYMPDHDGTAHAERLAATQACRTLSREVLASASLYSSAEPCAMCSGAIYWAGIGRVVYGLSEHRLRAITGDHRGEPDARPALPRCLCQWPAADRGGGAVARRRGRSAARRRVGEVGSPKNRKQPHAQ